MAHDWFMKHGNPKTAKHSLFLAWDYADAMQDEADKRKSKPEPPSLQQTFIDGVEQPRYAPPCEEWQPDTYPEYEHGRDYPSDAWVTFNGEARMAVSVKEESLRKRPQ